MTQYAKKLIWTEGAFLTQQHFQSWDKWNQRENSLDREQKGLWGVAICVIDEDALKNSLLLILRLKVLLPDYRWIEYDSTRDESILSLRLEKDVENIYLLYARGDKAMGIKGYPEISPDRTAFKAHYVEISDEFDTDRKAEVLISQHHSRLASKTIENDDSIVLKLAEVLKKKERVYELSDSYIPPILQMNSLYHGLHFIKTIKHSLEATIHVLKENKGLSKGEEYFNQLCLGMLLRYVVIFKSYLEWGDASPREAFLVLRQFLAEISAYSQQVDVAHDILYEHEALDNSFRRLTKKIILALKRYQFKKAHYISLIEEENRVFTARHLNDLDTNVSRLYLVVRTDSQDREAILTLEKETKCSTVGEMTTLLSFAVSGLKLKHLRYGVSSYHRFEEDEVFEIVRDGSCWEKVIHCQDIAVYFPFKLSNPSPTLIIEKC